MVDHAAIKRHIVCIKVLLEHGLFLRLALLSLARDGPGQKTRFGNDWVRLALVTGRGGAENGSEEMRQVLLAGL